MAVIPCKYPITVIMAFKNKLFGPNLSLKTQTCLSCLVPPPVAQSLTKTAKNPHIIFFEIYHFYYVFCFPVMWDDLPKHF